MAKKRIDIGNLAKSRDGNSRFLKVNLNPKVAESVTLKSGDYINLENLDAQLASLDEALSAGKLSPEFVASKKVQIEKDKTYGVIARAYITREE